MPRRRGVLRKVALAAIAIPASGCIRLPREGDPAKHPEDRDRPCWQNIEDERIDQEPFFDPEREDEMVIPEDEMHFQYDEYDDEDYPEYKAYIDTVDHSNTVLFKANVYATVEEAIESYSEVHESFEDPDSFGVGDEAMEQEARDGKFAEMVFRKSNAVGHVISYIPGEAPEDPDDRRFRPRSRVSRYSRQLRDYWGGTSDYKDHPGFCRQEVMDLQQPDEDD